MRFLAANIPFSAENGAILLCGCRESLLPAVKLCSNNQIDKNFNNQTVAAIFQFEVLN